MASPESPCDSGPGRASKCVVINADDLGASPGVNRAIRAAWQDGVLTSASLMVTLPAFEQAVNEVIPETPGLGLGLHLSLTEGTAVLRPRDCPLLADAHGRFKNQFHQLLFLCSGPCRHEALDQIERELRAQCDRVRASGLALDHVNSHEYVHMIPAIFRIVARLAREYGYPVIRLARERIVGGLSGKPPLINVVKACLIDSFQWRCREAVQSLRTADAFYGILHSGRVDEANLIAITRRVRRGTTEIVVHPGYGDSDFVGSARMKRWLSSQMRVRELHALLSGHVRRALNEKGITPVSFREQVGAYNEPEARATLRHDRKPHH